MFDLSSGTIVIKLVIHDPYEKDIFVHILKIHILEISSESFSPFLTKLSKHEH